MEGRGMRIVGIFLVLGVLLSYAPLIPMDDCPEGNHMGNVKMDCGFPFHCPMIVDITISETSNLPFNGLLISKRTLLLMDELTHPIFHPPEYLSANFIPRDEGRETFSVGIWHKNC
jgi:hypothetical protein